MPEDPPVPAPVFQYTPADSRPALGTACLHPDFDIPLMHDAIRPHHPQWTSVELCALTDLVSSQRETRYGCGGSIGFSGSRAHQVRNLANANANAASVHAYSPPLMPVRDFADLADDPPAEYAANQIATTGHAP